MADPRDEMARIAQQMAGSTDFANTVEQVVEFAQASTGADGAGLTLLRNNGFETVGATSTAVTQADQAQYDLEEGPCVDSATQVRTLRSDDLGTDDRWPRWGPLMAGIGFHSVLSAELHAGGRRIGALNLYGRETGAFDLDDAGLAEQFAQHAGVALAHSRKVDDLEIAMATRTLIGQAQGILIERHGLDGERAFAVLRRYSQETNTKLRDVADHLVRTARLPALGRVDDADAPVP